jgi:hypothetical protein
MPVALNEEDMLVVGKIRYAEKTGIPITILARMEK